MKEQDKKIQRVELSCYRNPLYCPFCGQAIVPEEEETDDISLNPCEHTVFIATDEGFEYRSRLFDERMGIVDVDDDDIDLGEHGYDGYTDNLAIEGVKFAIYVPPPSSFGSYYGFAEP